MTAAASAVALLAVLAWAASAGTAPAPSHTAPPARSTAAAQTASPEPSATFSPVSAARLGLARAGEPRAARWSSRDLGPTPPEYLSGYRWPVEHARITNAFGPGRPGNEVVDGEQMHDGLDISSFCGGHVVAAHDGVVLAAGRHYEGVVGWIGDLTPYRARMDARGWGGAAIAVVVDDGNGYRSIYLHLNLAIVKKGEVVRAGQMIGYQGSTGESTGCHLHYALFSPLDDRTIGLDRRVAARTRLPLLKIARIDPLLVLPPLEDADISWGWGAGEPSPSP